MSAHLPIVQYWDSPDRPEQVVELMATFARHNPDRPHIVFNAKSAEEFIRDRFTERESAAFAACGVPAMRADYLRYCAAFELGGVWSDAGFACRRNLSDLLAGSAGGELFYVRGSTQLLINGLLAFAVPRHPFPRLALRLATELIERRWPGQVDAVTGPMVITAIHTLHRAGSMEAALRTVEEQTPGWLAYAQLIFELIGEPERLAEACEGIRVHPRDHRLEWVHSKELPHRRSVHHWQRVGTDIYADTDRR